jgi:hypothetical protein
MAVLFTRGELCNVFFCYIILVGNSFCFGLVVDNRPVTEGFTPEKKLE